MLGEAGDKEPRWDYEEFLQAKREGRAKGYDSYEDYLEQVGWSFFEFAEYKPPATQKTSPWKWLIGILVAAAAIVGLFWFLSSIVGPLYVLALLILIGVPVIAKSPGMFVALAILMAILTLAGYLGTHGNDHDPVMALALATGLVLAALGVRSLF